MPGEDALYPEMEAVDRYPATEDEHRKILGWVTDSFEAADRVREPYRERWERYYQLYRCHIDRPKGDWRSKVFYPIVFFIVETIIPRIVAQLPKVVVRPVDEDDVEGAKLMEQLLGWAAERSDLYLSLVEMYRSALKYGTGICKVYHAHEVAKRRVRVPVMAPAPPIITNQPLMDPDTGGPMMDLDGQEMVEEVEEDDIDPATGEPAMIDTGETEVQWQERVRYDGPKAEWVSLLNFWVSPEATSIENASYVIQRYFRDTAYVKQQIEDGLYQLPEGKALSSLETGTRDPLVAQAQTVGLGSDDPTRKKVEVMELWTDDTVVTVLNREIVARVADNPFDHGMKPYIRVCDHYVEGEFYGIGEIEPLDGLQDQINALVNQRIDNVRLVLNRMFAFDPENIHDMRDLAMRPGGGIRVKAKDIPAGSVIQPIDTPDVTASSYQETAEAERMTEKASGVNAYTAGGGQDTTGLNNTATGVSLISEAGNTRFSLKVRMGELTGLRKLAEMYGSIWQQFADDEIVIRITGEQGQMSWPAIDGDAIQGGYDYHIVAESSTQTESVRKEQSMSLFQMALQSYRPDGSPIFNLDQLATDVLNDFEKRNTSDYLAPAPPPMPQMMPGQEMMPGMEAEGTDPAAAQAEAEAIAQAEAMMAQQQQQAPMPVQ